MNTRTFAALLPLLALLAAACAEDKTLENVDIVVKNTPPLAVSVSGAGLTLPTGIAVAVAVTPHVEGKVVDDKVTVSCRSACRVIEGKEKNEFFIVGWMPGSDTIDVTDIGASSLTIPITCTEQP